MRNSSEQTIERYLEIALPRLSSIEFHYPTPYGSYTHLNTGYSRPFSERPVRNRFFVLPFPISAHAEMILYLRIETPNAMIVPAQLWEPKAFYGHEKQDYVVQALFYGIAIAMLGFNLFFFAVVRDINYLFYMLFVSCSVLTWTVTSSPRTGQLFSRAMRRFESSVAKSIHRSVRSLSRA